MGRPKKNLLQYEKKDPEVLIKKEIENQTSSMAQSSPIPVDANDNPFIQDQIIMDQKRILPESDLELTFAFTNPQWGDESVNQDLQNRFKRVVVKKAYKGQIVTGDQGQPVVSDGSHNVVEEKNHWANLSFLTRDLRLANYDEKTYKFCSYFYELAGALLNQGYVEASSLSLEIGAIHGEMSQGKKGFLRRMQNTLIKEEKYSQMEVKKNSILSGKPKEGY
jgi:hypothetical protein